MAQCTLDGHMEHTWTTFQPTLALLQVLTCYKSDHTCIGAGEHRTGVEVLWDIVKRLGQLVHVHVPYILEQKPDLNKPQSLLFTRQEGSWGGGFRLQSQQTLGLR